MLAAALNLVCVLVGLFDADDVPPVVCATQIVFHGEGTVGKTTQWDRLVPVSVTQTYTRPEVTLGLQTLSLRVCLFHGPR